VDRRVQGVDRVPFGVSKEWTTSRTACAERGLYLAHTNVFNTASCTHPPRVRVRRVYATSADKLNKCGYFKFTNAVIEPHLINTHL